MFTPRHPYHVVIILTERCNLACSHCSSSSSNKTARMLSFEQVCFILDQLADAGIVDVAFSGGEPLLHPSIIKLIKYANKRGLKTGLSTNGYALTERRIRELLDSGLNRMQISLDGLEDEHDLIRGRGAYKRANEAIYRSTESGLSANICFTAMRQNFQALGDVIELGINAGVDGVNLSKLVPTGRGGLESCLGPSESEYVHKTYLSYKKKFPEIRFTSHLSGMCLYDSSVISDDGFIGCHAGIYIACVLVSGDITPCVLFPLILGNIFEKSFQEIWADSPDIANLKGRKVKGTCAACSYVSKCGGCRSTALGASGDYLAEDPLCPLVIDQR